MPRYPKFQADARLSFIVATYKPDAASNMVPERPTMGLCSERDDRSCVLCLDHLRHRVFGPGFPLTVLSCLVHNCAFTLYPPGFTPYGRKSVAPVAPDGSAVVQAPAEAHALTETVFEAAVDAAQGVAWARECPGGTAKWWGTQGRHLDRALDLCGVAPAPAPAAVSDARTPHGIRCTNPTWTLTFRACKLFFHNGPDGSWRQGCGSIESQSGLKS